MSLTRDQILACKDISIEKVEAPEWGGHFFVKALTGKERDRFERTVYTISEDGKAEMNLENFRSKLCVSSICDETGKLLFTDKDIPILTEKSAIVLDRASSVAQRLSGLSKNDVDKLTKNSKGVRSASSISA